MVSVLENLPNDVASLKKLVKEMATEHAKEVQALQNKLTIEQEKYAALQRLIFGPKSEKRQKENPKQDLLFNEAETFFATPNRTPATVTVSQHERTKAGRKPFPEDLERNEIVRKRAIVPVLTGA